VNTVKDGKKRYLAEYHLIWEEIASKICFWLFFFYNEEINYRWLSTEAFQDNSVFPGA